MARGVTSDPEIKLVSPLLRTSLMPRLRVELRTILALVAALALLLGWAKSWGWPGDLVLSVTQFPVAWLSWSVVGFLVGRCIYLPKPRSPLLARLLAHLRRHTPRRLGTAEVVPVVVPW